MAMSQVYGYVALFIKRGGIASGLAQLPTENDFQHICRCPEFSELNQPSPYLYFLLLLKLVAFEYTTIIFV